MTILDKIVADKQAAKWPQAKAALPGGSNCAMRLLRRPAGPRFLRPRWTAGGRSA